MPFMTQRWNGSRINSLGDGSSSHSPGSLSPTRPRPTSSSGKVINLYGPLHLTGPGGGKRGVPYTQKHKLKRRANRQAKTFSVENKTRTGNSKKKKKGKK